MRAISPHARYSIQVIEGLETVMMDARGHAFTQVTKKPVIANFEQGGLMDHEIEAALEYFSFSGVPDGVNPLTRISVWDSEAYGLANDLTKDQIKQIDDRLVYLSERHPAEFRVIDMPLKPKPWPSYDDDNAEDIIELQARLGIDPEVVRLYEAENAARKGVLKAMAERAGLDPDTLQAAEEKITVNA